MSDTNSIRSLSLDGGGMRGIRQVKFLQLLCQQFNIAQTDLWKYFDMISGSSIGGIIGLALAIGKTPDEIMTFFEEDGQWIFSRSTTIPSTMPSLLQKIAIIVGLSSTNTFYPNNVDGIGSHRLKSKLQSVFGTKTMQDVKTNVVITSFEKNEVNPDFAQDTNTPVYFSNSSIVPSLTGQNTLILDVAMATSAAPLFFSPYTIDSNLYIDGGVVQNNPASFGMAIAKSIKPSSTRACLLSLGTGLGDVGFPPAAAFNKRLKEEINILKGSDKNYLKKYDVNPNELPNLKYLADNLKLFEGGTLIMELLGIMTTGPQEIVSKELEIISKYSLSNLENDRLNYYRFQSYFDVAQDTEMDNSTPDILAYYKTEAATAFNGDISNISLFWSKMVA